MWEDCNTRQIFTRAPSRCEPSWVRLILLDDVPATPAEPRNNPLAQRCFCGAESGWSKYGLGDSTSRAGSASACKSGGLQKRTICAILSVRLLTLLHNQQPDRVGLGMRACGGQHEEAIISNRNRGRSGGNAAGNCGRCEYSAVTKPPRGFSYRVGSHHRGRYLLGPAAILASTPAAGLAISSSPADHSLIQWCRARSALRLRYRSVQLRLTSAPAAFLVAVKSVATSNSRGTG